MKKLLLVIFACGIAGTCFAQLRPALSVGGEIGFVQRSLYNLSYGFNGKVEVPVVQQLSVNVSGGYSWLHVKRIVLGNLQSTGGSDAYVPLKAGIKYYPSRQFYTEGELGAALQQDGNKDKLFAYSLGTGFIIPFGSSSWQALDLGFRYESWSKNRLQQFAIRAAYRFSW